MKKTITTAAIAALVLSAGVAMAAAPVCGDVNDDGSIKTTDALLVLKKAVAQPITLDCSAYDDQFSACETSLAGAIDSLAGCDSDLAVCKNAPVCGDGSVIAGEDCEVGNLDGETCATQPGFIGGTLACAPGCTFDTTGCYATRFDASGGTIIDHQTGLEWEKKDSPGGGLSGCPGGPTCANPHDVDNSYQWSSTSTAPDGGAFTDFLAKLNGGTSSGGPTTGCYAEHCDWRLPTLEEWFGATLPTVSEFQPDAESYYWSASTGESPTEAWIVYTDFGDAPFAPFKTTSHFVRAVRRGF